MPAATISRASSRGSRICRWSALSVPNLPDDYVEIEGSAEFFLPGSATPIQVNCGVERFGGAWTEFAKKELQLEFSAEYGARKLEAPLVQWLRPRACR